MRTVIGYENAGYTIIEATYTGENGGYAIGKNDLEYVTWWFNIGQGIDFYHGHYILIDPDAPAKARADAYADYFKRLAKAYEDLSKYGY